MRPEAGQACLIDQLSGLTSLKSENGSLPCEAYREDVRARPFVPNLTQNNQSAT